MRPLLSAVLAVVLLSACAEGQEPVAEPTAPFAEPSPEPAPTLAAAQPEDGEGCGPVETVPIQGGEHLIGDQEPPVPYSSVPPTSGWHTSGFFRVGVSGLDDPLSEPRQVSVLEAGGVVVSYRDLADEDRAVLEDLATDELEGRIAVTPYDQLEPGEVALTAWGTLQRCAGVDVDAVRAFVDEHADEGPIEPGHDR